LHITYESLLALNPLSVVLRVLLAVLFGGLIGSDRGRHGRAAGLRTHILVCLGAAMTTMIGIYVASDLGFANDPMRTGAQVVSGIGFLGAGTIMVRNRSHVTGLTTAAGLWTTACIGLAIGVGFYWAALVAFLAVMVTISVLSRVEPSARLRDPGTYYVELTDVHMVKGFYEDTASLISEIEIIPAKSGISSHVGLECVVGDRADSRSLFAKLQENENIVIAVPLRQ